MRQNSGVTLITLAITIIIMIIIAGVGISSGISSVQSAKIMQFDSEMRIIHARVNELVEEMKLDELNELGLSIPSSKSSNVNTALEGRSSAGFRYFDRSGLELIGVSNVDREVIINFSTKEVVDINGIDIDGTIMYRLADWTNIAYTDRNTEAPSFDLSKKVYGLNATILVENIEYGGNVGKGTVSYCAYNNETEGTWYTVPGTEIPVQATGTYKVRLTDAAGNIAEETVEVALANKPKLDTGMVPITIGSNDIITEVVENSGIWYDYSDLSKWAFAQDEDDTIWMWIPRCMYMISSENQASIKFLKGTTNIATDNTNEVISNSGENGTWNVHPIFSLENTETTGIWVERQTGEQTISSIIGLLDSNMPTP